MKSEWKERSIERNNFRRSKSEPEISKIRKKKKNKKIYKLVAKNISFFRERKKDYILNKYSNLKSAKEALKTQKHDLFWKEKNLIIEKI